MSCPSPQPLAPHHYSGAVKLQILVSLFSANSVWMELGTWEEAGHTSKASKVWATGGILIAWPAHKSKHYNSTQSRIQTRVVKTHIYLTRTREEKLDLTKSTNLPCFLSTKQLEDTFESARVHTSEKANKGTIWCQPVWLWFSRYLLPLEEKTFFKTHWEERWISGKLKQSLANYDVWSWRLQTLGSYIWVDSG